LVDRIGFMLNDSKLQFFGINGKCCTDNLFTNYLLDIYPISGDSQKNSFHFKQIKGDFFNKTMKNFIFNTEGGSSLKIRNFMRFCVDHCDETKHVIGNSMTLVNIYLWHVPEDFNQVSS
jgi:N-acetylneuraminic acid mutarotase